MSGEQGAPGADGSRDVVSLDIAGVMAALPHRYPLLLVDRVEELIRNRSIVAIKAVTINENYFAGHFPGRPIMPGVLIIEALAQTAGILAVESVGLSGTGRLVYFLAIDNAKFRKPVDPGVLLRLEAEFVHKRDPVYKVSAVAKVDGEVVAEARFTAMFVDPPKSASA